MPPLQPACPDPPHHIPFFFFLPPTESHVGLTVRGSGAIHVLILFFLKKKNLPGIRSARESLAVAADGEDRQRDRSLVPLAPDPGQPTNSTTHHMSGGLPAYLCTCQSTPEIHSTANSASIPVPNTLVSPMQSLQDVAELSRRRPKSRHPSLIKSRIHFHKYKDETPRNPRKNAHETVTTSVARVSRAASAMRPVAADIAAPPHCPAPYIYSGPQSRPVVKYSYL